MHSDTRQARVAVQEAMLNLFFILVQMYLFVSSMRCTILVRVADWHIVCSKFMVHELIVFSVNSGLFCATPLSLSLQSSPLLLLSTMLHSDTPCDMCHRPVSQSVRVTCHWLFDSKVLTQRPLAPLPMRCCASSSL